MERNAIHRNLFHFSVVQLIAFAQKVRARLRIRNHGDHAVRRAHHAIEAQRADLQPGLAWRKIFRIRRLRLLASDQRLEGIAAAAFAFAFRRRLCIAVGGLGRILGGRLRRLFCRGFFSR
jgi:hypothetical protein